MPILTREEFITKRKTNSVVILGSGYSINDIDSKSWEHLKEIDSIGFNWFCKHRFVPNYYVIREQANIKKRVSSDESPKLLLDRILSPEYKKTCLILLDVSSHSRGVFDYKKYVKKTERDCVILKDRNIKNKYIIKNTKKDIFKWGVYHSSCTLISVLHILIWLKYTSIYFAGVDLNDSRYFWLPPNKERHTIINKNKTVYSKHPVAKCVIKFISRFLKKNSSILFYTLNKESLLSKIIPYKNIAL